MIPHSKLGVWTTVATPHTLRRCDGLGDRACAEYTKRTRKALSEEKRLRIPELRTYTAALIGRLGMTGETTMNGAL
jgi:hypothetical protein